jgi:hypothetical protein
VGGALVETALVDKDATEGEAPCRAGTGTGEQWGQSQVEERESMPGSCLCFLILVLL